MSKFVVPDIATYSGIVKITFTNDDGNIGEQSLSDNILLKIAELVESVEESGFGGILRIGDMEIELVDRDGTLKTSVFPPGSITEVQCTQLLNVGGTDYTAIYGTVDLSTVGYPSHFDDESGLETHNAKVIVFSFIKNLELKTVSDVRTAIDSDVVLGDNIENSTNYYFIKVVDVFKNIMLFLGNNVSIEENVAQTFRVIGPRLGFPDAENDFNFADLYLLYRDANSGNYVDVWDDSGGNVGSFMYLKDGKSLLMQLAAQFLCYPLLTYDSGTDVFTLKLKQRGAGTILAPSDLGELLSSTPHAFYGYDAIRVKASAVYSSNNQSSELISEFISPGNLDDQHFQLLPRTFDFLNYLHVHTQTGQFYQGLFVKSLTGDYFAPVNFVLDGGTSYGQYSQFLLAKFVAYWSNPQMIERSYRGTGIGGDNPVEILDRIEVGGGPEIDGTRYSIIEIKRNILENEMTIKAVQFT